MSDRRKADWREAFSLFSVRTVVGQIEVAICVFVLFAVWLRVPDASGLEVAASVLLALLIVAVAGFGESVVFVRLCGRARTLRLMLLGTALLAAGTALWFGWSALLDHFHGDDAMRAGYLNSRQPHQLRYFFTYERIVLWLGWMWNTLTWIGAGVIVAAAVCGVGSTHPLRAMGQVLRSGMYWAVLIVGAIAAPIVTTSLIGWTPGHGLRREMASLILRLGTAILFDAVVLCLLLCAIAACCREVVSDEAQAAPAGIPEESQPRTTGNP
jgi:hypothetical protein